MKTTLDCLPCLLRQAVDTIRRSTPTEARRITVLRETLLAASSLDFELSPPELSRDLQALIRASTGCLDPYAEARQVFSDLAFNLLPSLEAAVRMDADPLAAAVRLAIAGNVIDLGAKSGLTLREAEATVAGAWLKPLLGDLNGLREAIRGSERILFLADNAGEIVLDTILLRLLPRGRVTVAVRGGPTLNDATVQDAVAAGIPDLARLMDNGADIPGTALERCSEEFRREFARADLILAKGQGNYETLHGCGAPVFFLFRVKCPIVADQCGHPLGSHVICR